MSKLCEYGCRQEAKHQFKNGKWCCENHPTKCPNISSKISKELTGKQLSEEHIKKLSESHKGLKYPPKSREAREKVSLVHKGKIVSKETRSKLSKINKGKTLPKETKLKMSLARKGKPRPDLVGKSLSKQSRKKLSISLRYSIEDINERYPIFSIEEEMRYNPDKPGEKEIQVHCKYNNCQNSKEKGGWFTPRRDSISARIGQVESNKGWNGLYFYCSEDCKKECILYHIHGDPLKEHKMPYTDQEYQTWRQEVKRRQLTENNLIENECEICGSKENLHIHHEKPQKTHPHMVLDPDNGIILCETCHYIYGHRNECSTGQLSQVSCL